MIQEATLGAGCFWCIEACFKDLKGIIDVVPGYAGGQLENPSYQAVCSGTTGHAEVVRVTFDDSIIDFSTILKMFFFVHDPTQLNRQGNDIGTQYRSVIFYHDEIQQQLANEIIHELEKNQVWERPIVTEVSPLSNFYFAEDYHKDYFNQNPTNLYCQAVVRPKIEKFNKVFGDLKR